MPKVSIIINCHNGEKYLEEAIDSIYAQTYQDWEIIFFDNVSTDNSAKIAQSYDSRLKYHKNHSLINLGAARKEAVQMATGEWVAFLDTDDLWYPIKLEKQLKALEGTDYIFCYAGIHEIEANGKSIRNVYPIHQSGQLLEALLTQFEVNMVTPMFKRVYAADLGINFEPDITASEEYNLFVRLAAKGSGLVQHELLGEYRVSTGSLTDRQISKWAVERRFTLNQLKKENINIENVFPKAFSEAEARGDYYEARYYASIGDIENARRLMSGIKHYSLQYNFLYAISHSHLLWRFFHKALIKRKMTLIANIFQVK
jgi:glycosyltransferase involved in cell wall biosynthesis